MCFLNVFIVTQEKIHQLGVADETINCFQPTIIGHVKRLQFFKANQLVDILEIAVAAVEVFEVETVLDSFEGGEVFIVADVEIRETRKYGHD